MLYLYIFVVYGQVNKYNRNLGQRVGLILSDEGKQKDGNIKEKFT